VKVTTDRCEEGPSNEVRFEFYFQSVDTLVLVQNRESGIIIRATEETFSDRRKENFIHELAMEGFIPDEYRWYHLGGPGLRWVRDRSWLRINEVAAAHTRQLMTRVAFVVAICTVILIGVCAPPTPERALHPASIGQHVMGRP
jgi:hypothetical protein